MALKAMAEAEIARELAKIPDWRLEGGEIVRTFTAKSFLAGIAFVNQVADAAEKADHHPDILVQYNKVTLRLSTHDASGITAKDFALAREANTFFSSL